MAATSQVTGRHDLLREPSAPHRWWDTVDPTYPVHVDRDPTPAMGANESGKVGLVGFPVQKEWSGSWREFMAEAARPKPNTMSSLHYTMQQTETEYIMHVTTHWKDLAKTKFHLDEATVHNYRPVAYVYITGPPPKESGNYPHDGPRGERDMNRGRITLPRGADLAKLREKGALAKCADCASGSLVLTIPKAPKAADVPTSEYIDPEEAGVAKQKRDVAAAEAEAAKRRGGGGH